VIAAAVCTELSESQKTQMLDRDTRYFILIFLGVIGFVILLENAKAYF
jgi:hypothetical protein